jgi:hypothetical protein
MRSFVVERAQRREEATEARSTERSIAHDIRVAGLAPAEVWSLAGYLSAAAVAALAEPEAGVVTVPARRNRIFASRDVVALVDEWFHRTGARRHTKEADKPMNDTTVRTLTLEHAAALASSTVALAAMLRLGMAKHLLAPRTWRKCAACGRFRRRRATCPCAGSRSA